MELIQGEVLRIEESISPLFPQMPLVHLAYLHIRLLTDQIVASVSTEPDVDDTLVGTDAVISTAINSINLFNSASLATSPLDHHFASLAAACLSTQPGPDHVGITGPLNTLRQLCTRDNPRLPPAWNSNLITYISKRLDAQSTKANRDGLQHLADAAVGADGGNIAREKADRSAVMESGYLRIFE